MHYGVVVIRTAKTVDRVVAVFVEVVFFALFGKKNILEIHINAKILYRNGWLCF